MHRPILPQCKWAIEANTWNKSLSNRSSIQGDQIRTFYCKIGKSYRTQVTVMLRNQKGGKKFIKTNMRICPVI